MKLAIVAALFAGLQQQQPDAAGNLSVNINDAINASNEFNAWQAAQPKTVDAPALQIWTLVQVIENAGEHSGVVGIVCGGAGDELQVNPGDGKPIISIDKQYVRQL
ncbi:hypothetical protein [Lacisediminimonas profundi]|uniref:hypothetical protein n=1 Tax=Lacisediminimonas profundi TaxID=2603856 RepID=UPI00124B0760|nr:hypothetical protein [Lacisediminimonas profundi]